MRQSWTVRAWMAIAAGVLLTVSACSGAGSAPTAAATGAGASSQPPASTSPSPSASPTPTPPPPPAMQVDSVTPQSGATVGVAMPISIVFSQPVATAARAAVEQALTVTTSVPVTGAWHWFSSRRVDFRPTTYWKSGTKVSLVADLTGVSNGNGRVGTHSYTSTFTIGADVETHVYADRHLTVVSENGQVVRSMPSDAGSPDWPSWDGTMAVVDKAPSVRMTSCSVGIACDKNDPNYYDITLPWDVHLTFSGTYVHYSTGDPYPGHSYGSHGCVHLSNADAQWFYNLSKMGDPVTISGTPRGNAAGDNGYADYNLTWPQWLAGSANGQFTTHA